MHAPVIGQLRVERGRQHATLAHGNRVAVRVAGEDFDVRPDVVDDWSPDETPCSGSSPSDGTSRSASKLSSWAAVAVAPHSHVQHPEDGRFPVGDSAGEQDQARAGAEHRGPSAGHGRHRLAQAVLVQEPAHGGRLAPGQDQRVEVNQVTRQAYFDGLSLISEMARTCSRTAPWSARTPMRARFGAGSIAYQPRTARRSRGGISPQLMPSIGAPRPVLTSATMSGLS